jgi:hypothetical protein
MDSPNYTQEIINEFKQLQYILHIRFWLG